MNTSRNKISVCCFSASDSSGHAGLQADLRTLSQLGVHGCSVVTALTAQNSQHVFNLSACSPQDLKQQWHSIVDDLPPVACKIGLLANSEQVADVIHFAQHHPAYWLADPVLKSSTGTHFHSDNIVDAYRSLLPHLDLITPNIPEAEQLLGHHIQSTKDIETAAKELRALGVKAVLIKGGHHPLNATRCQDYFLSTSHAFWLSSKKQHTLNSRGTGCVTASAIASFISQGKAVHDAVILAHAYVQQGLRLGYSVGSYAGPIDNGSRPTRLSDYPDVSHYANYSPPNSFACCDNQTLGLYPVIDSLDWLEKLLIEGVSTIQLRIKNLSGIPLHDTLSKAITLAKHYSARLFINDYWQLAIELGAYGVHLGQEDLDSANIDALRSANIRLGISTHSEYEWARAHALRPSYIALGAVYPTQTKPARVIGIQQFKHWVDILQQRYPVTAIGGINITNIDEVLNTGVKSIALVTAITQADNYREATQRLLHCIEGPQS